MRTRAGGAMPRPLHVSARALRGQRRWRLRQSVQRPKAMRPHPGRTTQSPLRLRQARIPQTNEPPSSRMREELSSGPVGVRQPPELRTVGRCGRCDLGEGAQAREQLDDSPLEVGKI